MSAKFFVAALPFLAACASGGPEPETVPDLGTARQEISIVGDTSNEERAAVFEAAAWWSTCGFDVGVGGLPVLFVDDASHVCSLEGTLGCYLPVSGVVVVQHRIDQGLLPVVIAHEFGHALGFPHEGDGLMSERTQVKTLTDAVCP